MTEANRRKVSRFLLAPDQDLRLLVTEEEQRELLEVQRAMLERSSHRLAIPAELAPRITIP